MASAMSPDKLSGAGCWFGGMDRKELEPRAVGLKQASLLLGVSEHTVRKHVRLGTIPSLRVGPARSRSTKAINDLTVKGV